jgi:hypothetical protein
VVTCTETASITEQQEPGLIGQAKRIQLVAGADKQNKSAMNVYEYKQECRLREGWWYKDGTRLKPTNPPHVARRSTATIKINNGSNTANAITTQHRRYTKRGMS